MRRSPASRERPFSGAAEAPGLPQTKPHRVHCPGPGAPLGRGHGFSWPFPRLMFQPGSWVLSDHKSTCRLLFPGSHDTCGLLFLEFRRPINSSTPGHCLPRAPALRPGSQQKSPPFPKPGATRPGCLGSQRLRGNHMIVLDGSLHANLHPPRPPWTSLWEDCQGRDFPRRSSASSTPLATLSAFVCSL